MLSDDIVEEITTTLEEKTPMTSKYKVATDITPPLSLGASTEALVLQSKLSVNSDNTQTFTQTSKPKSNLILTTGKKGLEISEKSRQHAAILKVVLSRLERAGLIRRYRVLSKNQDGSTTVKEIQITFDNTIWTENLELRVLSEDK